MRNSKMGLGLFLAIVVLLPGCIHVPTYKSRSLRFIDDNMSYRASTNGLIVRAKQLNNYDKKELFGQYSKRLSQSSHGSIEVIYISLHNLSANAYKLPIEGIGLEMIPYQEVARLMKTNIVGRIAGLIGSAFGMTMGAFIGWASIWLMCANNAPRWIFLTPWVGLGGAITSAVYADRYNSSIDQSLIMNKRLIEDLEDKTMPEGIVIQVGDRHEGLIFVKSADYHPQFTITMHEKNAADNVITFDVDLNHNQHEGNKNEQ